MRTCMDVHIHVHPLSQVCSYQGNVMRLQQLHGLLTFCLSALLGKVVMLWQKVGEVRR